MRQHIFRVFTGRQSRIQTGEKTDLFRGDRADAHKACVDRFGKDCWFLPECLDESVAVNGERIQFGLGILDEIRSSRQNLPHRTDLSGNVFDTVDDRTVLCTEDKVTVFAHYLHHKIFPT